MKQDKLEKFILENRKEFDVFEPEEKIWEKIDKRAALPRVHKISWKTIVLRVAAVVVIFVASYFFHDMIQENRDDQTIVYEQEVAGEELEQIKVLMEAEVYYTSQINFTKEEISRLTDNDPVLNEDINYDLEELEKVFKDLKNDLKDNSDNEEVIEAMIQNYRIKLQVLKEILHQLEKSKIVNENNRHEI